MACCCTVPIALCQWRFGWHFFDAGRGSTIGQTLTATDRSVGGIDVSPAVPVLNVVVSICCIDCYCSQHPTHTCQLAGIQCTGRNASLGSFLN